MDENEESLTNCVTALKSINFLDPNPWIPARTAGAVIAELERVIQRMRDG